MNSFFRNEDENVKDLLDRAMNIGEQMLLSGAEVHRVEDSLYRIMESFGAERTDVFIITSSMIVTVHTRDGDVITQTRRITSAGTDFQKLHKLNDLSRKICYEHMTTDEIDRELENIRTVKSYPFWLEVLSYAIIAGAFTLFFGGTWLDAALSFAIGAVARVLILISDRTVKNKIFTNFTASFASAGAAYLLYNYGVIPDVDEIIIGNIMTLIPGIGITNALRDLFTGDSIAGLLRTVESILNALAIAAGYFVLVLVMGDVGVVSAVSVPNEFLQVITGAVGTLGFAFLFNIRGKKLISVAIGGLLSWTLHLLVFHLTGSEVIGYIVSAGAMSVFADIMARIHKSPTTTFTIPTLVPLIPGGSLYKTMRYALTGDTALFFETGLNTLKLAAALALGIILVSVLTKPIMRYLNIKTHRRKMLEKHIGK